MRRVFFFSEFVMTARPPGAGLKIFIFWRFAGQLVYFWNELRSSRTFLFVRHEHESFVKVLYSNVDITLFMCFLRFLELLAYSGLVITKGPLVTERRALLSLGRFWGLFGLNSGQ